MMIYQRRQVNPLYLIAIFALVIIALFYIAKGIFNLLAFAAPFLIIATFFIDRDVIIDYGKNIINQIRKNTLVGVIMLLFTIFGFPLVSGYLFAKALIKRQIKQRFGDFQQPKGGYTDYEEVKEDDDFLELPELTKEYSTQKKSNSSDYEQLFD